MKFKDILPEDIKVGDYAKISFPENKLKRPHGRIDEPPLPLKQFYSRKTGQLTEVVGPVYRFFVATRKELVNVPLSAIGRVWGQRP